MERVTTIIEAKELMGSNFVGPHELKLIADKIAIKIPVIVPSIPFKLEELKSKQNDYLLILGTSEMQNGEPLTLKSLRNQFGINPEISEPCFYNQDWYLNENFFEKPLETKWFLIRKSILPESRGKNPEVMKTISAFPSAILCAYSFFVNWYFTKDYLWKYDFVWCNDLDYNGDRIYVGKYYDINCINKNGFSIHRHLQIRNNYGAIEFI
jgi:hypothetical protein